MANLILTPFSLFWPLTLKLATQVAKELRQILFRSTSCPTVRQWSRVYCRSHQSASVPMAGSCAGVNLEARLITETGLWNIRWFRGCGIIDVLLGRAAFSSSNKTLINRTMRELKYLHTRRRLARNEGLASGQRYPKSCWQKLTR